jgi:hypothetical protein
VIDEVARCMCVWSSRRRRACPYRQTIAHPFAFAGEIPHCLAEISRICSSSLGNSTILDRSRRSAYPRHRICTATELTSPFTVSTQVARNSLVTSPSHPHPHAPTNQLRYVVVQAHCAGLIHKAGGAMGSLAHPHVGEHCTAVRWMYYY